VVEEARNRLNIHARLVDYPGGEIGFARDAALSALPVPDEVVGLLREARKALIGNTAIILGGRNPEQAQAAGARLNDLCERIDTLLGTTGGGE